jgi:uncharacterized protein HemX
VAWRGWLIVVAVVAVATGIIVWLLVRKQQGFGRELVEAEKVKGERLAAEAKAEREAKEKIAAELQRFADENRKLQAWYNEQKDRIAKEAQDEFAKLATDPSELDRRLDSLLGTGPKPT